MSNRRRAKQMAVTGAALFLSSCSILAPGGPVSTEGMSNEAVTVRSPTAVVEGGVLVISGDVRRQPGVNRLVKGHVIIQICDGTGKQITEMPSLLTPNPIPTEGRAESQYLARYGWVPTGGAKVQVVFVEDREMALK